MKVLKLIAARLVSPSLCEEIKTNDLEYVDGGWHDWYFDKVSKRIKELVRKKEVQSNTLFYEGIDGDVLEMWLSSRGLN